MCGGGGGSSNNAPDNSANAPGTQEAINAARDAATAAQQASDNQRTKFTNDLTNAITGAGATGSNYFQARGLDPNDSGDINQIIAGIQRQVPDLDPNPAQYFSDDAFASGVDKIQTANRQGLNAKLGTVFAPGFENTLIPDSSDDAILNSILGDQQKTAQTTVDFNKARGLLNDQGYTAAEDALNQQGSAGKATLTGIGNSVLGVDRGHLTDIRGQAGDAASNYSFGQPEPDFSSYYGRAQSTAASDLSNLEGSIRGAVGNTNLFDPATALQKGGIMQGPINLTTAAPGSGGPAPKQAVDPSRSLGSTGAF
jgi:hypothetical protein